MLPTSFSFEVKQDQVFCVSGYLVTPNPMDYSQCGKFLFSSNFFLSLIILRKLIIDGIINSYYSFLGIYRVRNNFSYQSNLFDIYATHLVFYLRVQMILKFM